MKLIKLRTYIGAAVVAFAASFSMSGTAAAQALFLPVTTAESAAVADATPSRHAKRSRLVRLDANVLANRIAPPNADNDADRAERSARLPDTLRLNLFDDVTPTLKRTSVSARATGGYTWEGIVPGRVIHEALLSVKNGQISGRVQLNNRLFSIDPVAGATHRITEVDSSNFPPEAPPRVRPQNRTDTQPAPKPADGASEAAEAATIVRVLVAYTTKARQEAGGTVPMEAKIDQAIDLANQAYARGGIPMLLQLAGSMVVVYNEGNGTPNQFGTNLEDLTDGLQFAPVRTRRDQSNADLVALLRSDPANCGTQCACGIAWFPGGGAMPMPSAATRETGFSVTAHGCITNLSFHHELGHNMGLNHDRYVSDPAGTAIYNFGFVNFQKRVRTIMAYNNFCAERGQNCTRINWFSSPTIRATGDVVIGRARNTAGAADNTLRLKQTRTPISQYE